MGERRRSPCWGGGLAAGGGAAGSAGGGRAPAVWTPSRSMGLGSSGKEIFEDILAMIPLRYMRRLIETNRGNALTTSAASSMQGFATGVIAGDRSDERCLAESPATSVHQARHPLAVRYARQFGAMSAGWSRTHHGRRGTWRASARCR